MTVLTVRRIRISRWPSPARLRAAPLPGRDHIPVNQSHIVHILRNEGTVPAVVYVTWLVPVGANPIRVDEPAPGNCPF